MSACRSYNWDIGTTGEVTLDPNRFFEWTVPANPVLVDAGIAKQILELWRAGIWTHSCCCGHGRQNPSVVIAEESDAEAAKVLLASSDPGRRWGVMQWRLVTV